MSRPFVGWLTGRSVVVPGPQKPRRFLLLHLSGWFITKLDLAWYAPFGFTFSAIAWRRRFRWAR